MNNLPHPDWQHRSFTRHEPMPVERAPTWFKLFLCVSAIGFGAAWVGSGVLW